MASFEDGLNEDTNAAIIAADINDDETNQGLVNNDTLQTGAEPIQTFGDPENFRDILCIIISSILCCPLLPCASWISLYYHQKATEAYWRGDYTTAGLKQSISVKWLIGQCIVSPIILIIIMIAAGQEVLKDLYPIQLENGAE
mmetsp:Transcript_77400/g.69304  ORF Transcript_77400/g.69304 Transcript_77400/m.69304 type:complete len:143 (+) Transcript_77400:23-451(+)